VASVSTVVRVAPLALDFVPRVCALPKTFTRRFSQRFRCQTGQTRLFSYGDRIFFREGRSEALREVIGEPPWLVPRVSFPLDSWGLGQDGDVMLIDRHGRIYVWRPGGEPALEWSAGVAGLQVSAVGLGHGTILVRRGKLDLQDPANMKTELIDTSSGESRWSRRGAFAHVLPCGDAFLAVPFLEPPNVLCVESATGDVRWTYDDPDAGNFIGVVDDHVWLNTREHRVFALRLSDGQRAAEIALRSRSPSGLLDPRGRFHACSGLRYEVVDLSNGQARLVSTVEFENGPDAPTTASGSLAVLCADGRVVFSDDKGKVFVVHPESPARPECIWSESRVFNQGAAGDNLVLLDWDGGLTVLGSEP
jgi:outer membrane protein assembly factor BamB